MTRHDETVCLAVIDGDESVFVAIEETTQPVRLQTWVGRRAPAFASASGRVILAGRPAEAVAAEFGGRALMTPTGRRLQTIAELQEILARVRRDGFAENHEETAAGLYTASVPIVNETGTVLAAMTMCVPTSRMDAGRRDGLLADLIAAGRGALARRRVAARVRRQARVTAADGATDARRAAPAGGAARRARARAAAGCGSRTRACSTAPARRSATAPACSSRTA